MPRSDEWAEAVWLVILTAGFYGFIPLDIGVVVMLYPTIISKIMAHSGEVTKNEIECLVAQIFPTPQVAGWSLQRSAELDEQVKVDICLDVLRLATRLLREGRLSSSGHARIERAALGVVEGLSKRVYGDERPGTLVLDFQDISFQGSLFPEQLRLKSITFSRCEFNRGMDVQGLEVQQPPIFYGCTAPMGTEIRIHMLRDENYKYGPDWRPTYFFAYCRFHSLSFKNSVAFVFILQCRIGNLQATLSPPSIVQKVGTSIGREYIVIEDLDDPLYYRPVAEWWVNARGWTIGKHQSSQDNEGGE